MVSNAFWRVRRWHWVALLGALLLAGCVSTGEESKFELDRDKALQSHVNLALKYIESKNRESARHHLRRAFELDSDSVDATFAMAMLYQLEGESKHAEEYFEKALDLDEDYTRARNNYGAFLFEQGRYQDAYEQFTIAVKDLDYDNRAQALVNLGRTALKLDKRQRAEASFEHANRLNPGLAVVKYELASLYFDEGDYAKAKQYLDAFDQIAKPVPQTLLLDIKIERIFGNKDAEASHALILKNQYPYSPEYLEYKQMQKAE